MMISFKSAIKLGVAATVPMLSCQNSAKKPDVRPNIVFILLDDLGYSDIGCYGSSFYETPNIDRLASEGIRFTSAYASCPVSSPTRASLMTGKYPVNTGITEWIPGRQATNHGGPYDKLLAPPFTLMLDTSELTIAEVLRENGYRTMISGKWHLGEDSLYWPEYQGFDINKGGWRAGQPFISDSCNGFFSPYGNPRLEDGPAGEYMTDRQTDEALKFISDSRDDPFFLYLSYYAVHNPMQAKEEHVNKFRLKADSLGLSEMNPFTREKDWIRSYMSDDFRERILQSNPVYAAMIWSVDENIGRVLSTLKELGISDNTIVIFTSDNGGLATSAGSPTCNYPLRAGKGWMYEGGIRVPLIIKDPMAGRQGVIADFPVSTIDFFPTLAEYSGAEIDTSKIDGISIVEGYKTGRFQTRPLFWHYPHYNNQGTEPGSAIRFGNYKLIDNFEKDRVELYNLEKDLSETNDIAKSEPEKTQELLSLLKEWRKKYNAKMMEPNPGWVGLK